MRERDARLNVRMADSLRGCCTQGQRLGTPLEVVERARSPATTLMMKRIPPDGAYVGGVVAKQHVRRVSYL